MVIYMRTGHYSANGGMVMTNFTKEELQFQKIF